MRDSKTLPLEHPSKAFSGGISLKASLLYSFAGQFFYLTSQLGVLSALAHFHGPTAVGEFGLAFAISTPLFLLLNMGFRTAQAVDIGKAFTFADYGGTRLFLTTIAAVSSILLAAAYSERYSVFLITIVVALAKAFESISDLAYGAFEQAGRTDFVATSFVLRGIATVVVFVSLLLLGADTATALMGQAVVWASIALFLDYPRASRLASGGFMLPRCSMRNSWRLLRHSAPLGGGLLANSLQMTIPRLMVERFLGLDALGLFTAVIYFFQASIVASNSISSVLVNRLAVLSWNGQQKKLWRILARLLLLFFAVGITGIAICYFFGDLVLLVLFGKPYVAAAPLLIVVSIIISLRIISTVPQSLFFAEQRYKEFLGFQVVSLVLTVILCYLMILKYGLLGAGYALLAVAVFRLVVMALAITLSRHSKKPSKIEATANEPP
jgi:O-antigen/teichoic acid export membrane protein